MIRTHYDPLPIPDRRHDWRAVTADYEPGAPVGYGATEQEAIDDLLDQLEDADELDAGETAHGDLIRLQLMRRDLQVEKERLTRERNDLTEIIDRLSNRIARIDEQLAVAGILTRAEGSA